ncbi:origin recognition complex subunit 3 [Ooceraea biroi]|uniref:origin recognition complex subunit 3 n=1 Tax=Ooceraea biroi TaxID=2015173 RepID=UPI000F088C3A|nr:origin recognition complex subunit 3 [Ooceraea biroi]
MTTRRMENVSVSKGIFAHKGNYKIGKKRKSTQNLEYCNEPWYVAYSETWRRIEQAAENVRSEMFQQVMSNLKSFVLTIKANPLTTSHEIATAILLTGVNVPDHTTLFDTTVSKLSKVTSHIAVLWSRNCNKIKNIIEDTVYQLIQKSESNDDDASEVRKSQCTMRVLKDWFAKHHDPEDPLVIILPDFESFSTDVLHDFILVLSSYRSTLKFVLIFGVATTLHVVHRSLTYDVTSKLIVQVFHTQTQVKTLSDVLDATVFSSNIPFRLIGRVFQLLTDIFLFYDFSVDNFLQNYKICMIQHFYDNNITFLCCQPKDIKKRISRLNDENIEEIKNLPSIVKYLKTSSEVTNRNDNLSNEKFKEMLEPLLKNFHKYMDVFLIVLRCLHCLVASLPGSPIGKQLRELYTKIYTSNLLASLEYKECLKLLGFLSKEELLTKLESIMKILDTSEDPIVKEIKSTLDSHINTIREASLDVTGASSEVISMDEKLSRIQLKEKLLRMSQKQSRSAYKEAQLDLINYLDRKVFSVHLIRPNHVTGYEIFCYRDENQAKHHIRGSLRAAIHTGLSDPRMYLDCDCCRLANDSDIPRTLPDLSIIYKLHLESRKLINMYDWLQAFLTIVNPQIQFTEEREVNAGLQARFTQAVAALQFLGFIETSRRKTDHVRRLT